MRKIYVMFGIPALLAGSISIIMAAGFREPVDLSGRVPGYTLDDCHGICGDEIEHTVRWKGGEDVSSLASRPIRLHFEMTHAKLYSFRFV